MYKVSIALNSDFKTVNKIELVMKLVGVFAVL